MSWFDRISLAVALGNVLFAINDLVGQRPGQALLGAGLGAFVLLTIPAKKAVRA